MDTKEIFQQIYAVAKKLDLDIYVVGGFVRDELMGLEHKKDIDFVVDGSGLQFAKAFDEHLKQAGSLIEFPNFDTARYVLGEDEKKIEVEFAGARQESYAVNSRKPEVKKATIDEDLSRRDFTVNAMARKVGARGLQAKVIDPFNGQKDLQDKILRTPLDPDVTFFDDPLRMLRAARFAAQLDFSIDPNTLSSIIKNVDRLKIISAERIKEELFKLLAARQPSIGLQILYGTKLLDQFLPEISDLAGVEEVGGYTHKDNLSHTFAVVDNIALYSPKVLLRYAGLMHDVAKTGTKKFVHGRGWTFDMHEHLGKKMVHVIGRRLRMSRDEVMYVAKLVRWHLQPIALMDEEITDSAVRRLIVNLGDDLQDLLYLCRSDVTTGNQTKKARRLANYEKLDSRIIEVIENDKMRSFQSPLRGDEIMKECGLRPGPTVGKIKLDIEEAIIEGKIPNEYEAAKTYFAGIKDKYLSAAEAWEKV